MPHRSLWRAELARWPFLTLTATALLASAGWAWTRPEPASLGEPGALGSPIPVRPRPLPITIYPIEGWAPERRDLVVAADVLRPYFRRNKVPVSLVYHAMRLWGPDVPFSPRDVPIEPSEGLTGEGLFLRCLTDQRTYEANSKFTLDRLLVPSPFGVQVVTSVVDVGWGQEWGSTHIGKYLQVMSDVEAPSDTPLMLAGDRPARLADVVQDEARRYHPTQELEWVTCGLARYLAVPRWQNRFGQWISFDDLAEILVKRPFGQSACEGTHAPYALATLLNAHTTSPLLSAGRAREVRERLLEYTRFLAGRQQSDGSWTAGWWEDEHDGEHHKTGAAEGVHGKITATGHILEWMVILPTELRPEPAALRRAADFILATIPKLREKILSDFHDYLPTSHALHALVMAGGRRWADPRWLEHTHFRSGYRD